jgi:N-carbamoylputrescine amidase
MLRIGLLHLAPRVGQIGHNQNLMESGLVAAAELGVDWVVTPELCISGYEFAPRIGTAWIEPQPDAWMASFAALVARLKLTVFLGHVDRDSTTGKLYNTVFVIGPQGSLLGKHRKRTVVPGIESWASPGDDIQPILIPSASTSAGVLICADAYTPEVACRLKEQGAQILISSAAWGPFPHGPETSWEDRSRETGLPLIVCNRTGPDSTLSFNDAESVVVMGGRRLLSHTSPLSTLVVAHWDFERRSLARYFTQSLVPRTQPTVAGGLVGM